MILKNSLAVFSLFFLLACSSSDLKKNTGGFFIGSGVERYFLADIPNWVQFSSIGDCHHKESIRYLNYETLGNSYSLDYEQLVQFQYIINQEYAKGSGIEEKDQEKFFYASYEKIKGGTRSFRRPDFGKINLIWIDDYITAKLKLSKLQKLLESNKMQEGFPVFVSQCLSDKELYDFLTKETSLSQFSTTYIPREMFSLYTADFKMGANFSINFKPLFKPNQKLYFFSTRDYETKHFINYDVFKKY